jgi:putative transposase
MKKKTFTEQTIIGILKEHEAGATVADLSRRHGVSEQSIYRWKAKFWGMDVSDAKRLREPEQENGKLKRLLADSMLDNAALTEIVRGKW